MAKKGNRLTEAHNPPEMPAVKPARVDVRQEIDHVLEILKNLPMLRRYGSDGEALEEAKTILQRVKEGL